MSKSFPTLPQISHDLRNYISAISGLAGLISGNLSEIKNDLLLKQQQNGARNNCGCGKNDFNKVIFDEEKFNEALELSQLLEPYTKEAMHYVQDILDASLKNKHNNSDDIKRLENAAFGLGEAVKCDVKEVINSMLILKKSFIAQNKIIVETNIEENLPKLKTDIQRLKQILSNLITNAIKYSQIGSKIEISAKFLAPKILIAIKDYGIGMALNGYGKQIDKSLSEKPIDSYGLGLPIVKQLAELLSGELEIESEKGVGTIVKIAFVC